MKWILPVIVIAQFLCTSLWFVGNAILGDIANTFHLDSAFVAHLTSAVQIGFIIGTLVFALLAISDRFSPSVVFFISAICAALCNLGITLDYLNAGGLLSFRFLTGFFLAGIYPVGMKIASDYYQQGLSKSLGFLVGALVLGTSFPHLLKSITLDFSWHTVVYATSLLAAFGGLAILLFVPNGPFRKQSKQFTITTFAKGFQHSHFRSAAIGYFGHMWELYTFWAFVPIILTAYTKQYPTVDFNISFLSFAIIGTGSLACIFSGLLSQYLGVKRIATLALLLSCTCCLVSPLFLLNTSTLAFIVFLFFWGIVVIADSPLFSTLVASYAPEESRGTSLTIVNCIGFSVTIISIQFLNLLSTHIDAQYLYMVLAVGPLIGLVALIKKNL